MNDDSNSTRGSGGPLTGKASMSNLFRRGPASTPCRSIRDTLFGDMPLDAWPPSDDRGSHLEPWRSFVLAREAMTSGGLADAIAAWRRISQMPDLESRHYAQAWHFLRSNGVSPPDNETKRLLGVVVEVPMHGGLDLLAVYPERTARYYNYSGAGVVWEHPDQSLDPHIEALLASGNRILQAIGPWQKPRPAPPPRGYIRINVLAPAGLHFGQGPFKEFSEDPLAKPAVAAATILMQQLISRTRQR